VGKKVVIESRNVGFGAEGEFALRYGDGECSTQVMVHALDRRSGERAVYVELREFDSGEILSNIIVDRDQFVEGLLATFPELQRKGQ
jgi:hypothetical protein